MAFSLPDKQQIILKIDAPARKDWVAVDKKKKNYTKTPTGSPE